MSQKGPNALWLLLALLVGGMFYLFWYNSVNRDVKTVSYSKFVSMVEEDKVEKITVQDNYVYGALRQNGLQFETHIMPTEKLWELLASHNVNVSVIPIDKPGWGATLLLLMMLSFLFFAVLFYFRQGQGGGGGASKIFNVGKSKARFFSPNTVNVTFKDVAGVDEAKDDLQDIIKFLKDPKKFGRLGAKIPKGVLLSGAPGNGKTLLAKAVAGEASCPFFSISGSDFVEVFVGVGASRVRDLFVQARKHSPCIVFIDEIDAVGRQRGVGLGGGNDEREQTLNQLLSEMDGFSTEHGSVIVLAATNRPDVLDNALLRPGRFDRIVEVPYPDLKSREKILQIHASRITLKPGLDLLRVARGTPGFSGADLENLVNESALSASKADKQFVEIGDFEQARDKLLLGAERKTVVLSEKDKIQTAYHESGHALVNVLLEDADLLHKVTIVPRGRSMGASWSFPEEDRHIESVDLMRAKIMIALGGLLAEKLVFDTQSTGAASDISHATKIARRMVCKYGMSKLGPIVFGNNTDHPYLGRDIMRHSADYSEDTARKIDAEISDIITSCYNSAEKLLVDNKGKLEILAKGLLEQETLQAKEVYHLLGMKLRKFHSLTDADDPSDELGDGEVRPIQAG
ncbi:ATP-dependent zinc metalloprotease FtsH [Candidatus Dependentiae bacterium]|nr:ATP-dependent zinc metalloprotease FtsH [Candidatus Dependentiae bacterium]